ncbi:rhomboid family intramembrane serine protease [Corynebacterium gerontici]|uniref:Rhomboid protease GluP n=1 Tax=Corynebacterium gerontici TaxID=2079234 RepID=A0A3G6IX73_9CORY|nr:rhomboid family intramembrane serine protease [Corynebacterium gerontici]AZA10365.1 Rhomboid protease GluP [Corynebacterium gerontici]
MSSLARSVKNFARPAPVTATLLLLNVLAFAITVLQSRSLMHPLQASSFAEHGILYAPYMHAPIEWLRALSALFLHIDPTHLGFNMLMLFLIGREVERGLGSIPYLGAYLACGMGGSLAVMLQAPLSPTVGASSSLYGLMAILLAFSIRNRTQVTAALVLIAVNFGYSLITPNVSLWGHIGGFAVGVLLGALMFSRLRFRLWVWGVMAVEVFGVAMVGNALAV